MNHAYHYSKIFLKNGEIMNIKIKSLMLLSLLVGLCSSIESRLGVGGGVGVGRPGVGVGGVGVGRGVGVGVGRPGVGVGRAGYGGAGYRGGYQSYGSAPY